MSKWNTFFGPSGFGIQTFRKCFVEQKLEPQMIVQDTYIPVLLAHGGNFKLKKIR